MPDADRLGLWRTAWARPGTRLGALVVLLAGLLGIYGPFLAGEVALVWVDQQGLSFPLLRDLFNRWSHPHWYDLLFNLVALSLPFLAAFAWFSRSWRSQLARWSVAVGAVLGLLVLCQLPIIPGTAESGSRAIWRHRPATMQVVERQAEARFCVFPPIRFRPDTPIAGQVLKSPGEVDQASGRRFLLGTDSAGKDVAAQMIHGARISLTVGLVATGLSLAIGLLIGALSGFMGGKIDLLLQRLVEIMMCFPTFILILVVVAMLGRDIFIIMTVIGLTSWAGTARLVRGEFLAQSVRDYVMAGQALGFGRFRLMFRHILPNALTPLLISATFGVAGSIGAEAGLSFIGLGDPTVASWGTLLEQGRQNIQYGWLIYVPGITLFLLIWSLNLMGEGLREALNVQAR